MFPEVTGNTHIVFLWCRVTPIVFIPDKASSFPGLQYVPLCPLQCWRPELIGFHYWVSLGKLLHTPTKVSTDIQLKISFLSITPYTLFWIFSLKQRFPLASVLPRQSFIIAYASPAFQQNCLSQPCPALVHHPVKRKHSTCNAGSKTWIFSIMKEPQLQSSLWELQL